MITEEVVVLNNLKINVKLAGQGNILILLIHGSCMSSEVWLPQLESKELNRHFRLIAFDLPGHGESEWIETDASGYRARNLAKLVPAILDFYDVHMYILVGLSFGTSIIGEINQRVKNCAGIVLASPYILNHTISVGDILIPTPLGEVMIAPNPSQQDLEAYVFHHVKNEQIAKKYIESYRNTDPAFRVEMGRAMGESDWSDEWKNIKNWNVPLCIVFGKEETFLNTSYLDDYASGENNHLFKIEHAGHMVNQEQPVEFNRILNAFGLKNIK